VACFIKKGMHNYLRQLYLSMLTIFLIEAMNTL
jgi:hypothetical protein